MKVLLDTDVLISFLLAPTPALMVTAVVRSCVLGPVVPLVPPELVAELRRTVAEKECLRQRIPAAEVEVLVDQLADVGECPKPLVAAGTFSRDASDDYLVAQALVSKVDYLVTGDPDLLVLDPVERLRIVAPARFVTVLQEEGLLSS